MIRPPLYLWVIYDHPRDYPCQWVARKWNYDKPTDEVLGADTLEQLREMLPPGLFGLRSSVDDDPCIREIWL